MSGRAPYGPPLEKVAECVCEVFPMNTPLGPHKAAKDCSEYHESTVDPRTISRYVTKDLSELNRVTSKKCGKKATEKCVKQGFQIVQSLNGAMKDQKKPPPSEQPPGVFNAENKNVCATDLVRAHDIKGGVQNFGPFPPNRVGLLRKSLVI
jgi:hypothetical protein